MPPRAISSPSRYRAAGFVTPAGMPTPPARSAAASGSPVDAAGSLVRGGSSRGYSGLAVPSPEVAGHTGGHSNPRPGGMPGYGRGAESARTVTSAPRGQF